MEDSKVADAEQAPRSVFIGIDPGIRNMGIVAVDKDSMKIIYAKCIHAYEGDGDARKLGAYDGVHKTLQAICSDKELVDILKTCKVLVGVESQLHTSQKKLCLINGALLGFFLSKGFHVKLVRKNQYLPLACTGSHHRNKSISVRMHSNRLLEYCGEKGQPMFKKSDDVADALAIADFLIIQHGANF